MKAIPCKLIYGEGFIQCALVEATHVKINIPGPNGIKYLPVILKGRREGSNCWTWNGKVDLPTLKPSVKTDGYNNGLPFVCHSWINEGKAIFLEDSTHEFKGQTLDLIEVVEDG